jgi:hypothetical protein
MTGFIGEPGVMTFYFLDGSSALGALHGFAENIGVIMPDKVNLQVENSGDRIVAETGVLVGSWSGTAQEPVVGASAGFYPAPAGAVINWLTGSIFDGHRLRGRTFVVPLAGDSYQTDGSIVPERLATLRGAAESFRTGQTSNFVIWHRPFDGTPATPGHPARPEHGGSWAAVDSSNVPDKVAVLRSRRD